MLLEPSPSTTAPALVAVYRRTIAASLARIWENVLDWEHLPWLHRTSFRAIRLIDANSDGWRAWVTLPPVDAPWEIELDVRLDRPHRCYSARTVSGQGIGTEIITRLDPIGAHATNIAVEFHVPGVPRDHAATVGDAYVRLYTQLWDEDQAMMTRRQALLDGTIESQRATVTPPPLSLGSLSALRARLPLVVETGGRRFRLVEVAGEIIAHAVVCPHRGGPLDEAPVDGGCITCPWHGYRFDLRTGRNVDGRECHLDPAPRVQTDFESNEALMVWSPE